jgi:hypothetical protein
MPSGGLSWAQKAAEHGAVTPAPPDHHQNGALTMANNEFTASQQPQEMTCAVTQQYDFLNTNSEGDKLFSVRGGIPLTDAFDQLSLLIAQGQSVVEAGSVTSDADAVPDITHAAAQLLELAYALTQAMHNGLIQHQKAITKP